ncbi:cyclic nucleotide-binding domain-containing protein [bacterium]|nr:cyclic nucleotide-binding domain-containing protein [bacterium]
MFDELKDFPFFKIFNEEEMTKLSGLMQIVDFKDGEMILDECEESSVICFILEGKVKIFKKEPDILKILTYLEPTDVFGEMSFVDKQACSASASAVGDVKLAVLTSEKFDNLKEENVDKLPSKFLIEMMKEITRKFRAVNEGLDVKSADYTLHELITSSKRIKLSTDGGTEYICVIKHADLSQHFPLLKIDIKGQTILIPFQQVKTITLPNKFGNF